MDSDKNVVFDIVGTLVGYDVMFDAIDERLGARLREQGVKPTLLGYTWIEVAEREYTYLSMSGAYRTYADVFRKIFWRMLWKAGIEDARGFATDEDLDFVMAAYQRMTMRPGAAECVRKLRDAGFTVWGFTMGDLKRVAGYFEQAGIDMPAENLKSCDSSKIGKPDPEAYKPLLKQLSATGSQPWFAAAHMWDVSAAKRTGFKGAYCSVWENEPLEDLFGSQDVVANTLPDMADKIIAAAN